MKKSTKSILLIAGILVLTLILLGGISGLIVKYLWLDNMHYEGVFWTVKIAEFSLFFITLFVVLLYVGLNFRVISKYLRPIHLDLGVGPDGTPHALNISRKRIRLVLYIFIILLALIFSFSMSHQWDSWLRFIHAQPFGKVDSVFGKDIGFYIFQLPFIETVQNGVTTLAFIVTLFVTVYYLLSEGITIGQMGKGRKFSLPVYGKKQIFANLGIWFILLGSGYFLDRFHLLNKQNELIYGANYTDIHVLLPVYWVMIVGCLLIGVYSFLQFKKYTYKKFLIGVGGLFVVGFIGQTLIPGVVQNLVVDPSEFTKEKPYLQASIHATRDAYRLNNVKKIKYNAEDTISLEQVLNHKEAIKNVRIWDQNLTTATYKQLQEIRSYYQFYNIDLDRYHTKEGYRQVLISARELATQLPPQARTWVNEKMQYTHGYGIVMSPTTQKTKEGNPLFYIKNIPPESNMGLKVTQPAIYYGEKSGGYKIVNTKISEMDYPKGDQNVYTHYKGSGGVPIDNSLSRLLFAWHFSDINILMTDYIQKGSKIQFWNAIETRVNKIAPFLKLDDDPYIVLDHGKLYWIIDAYTFASNYPYSSPFNRRSNYIRNSVKVIVDAYNGTVKFYVSNPDDPVIQVYKEIFPNMFNSLTKMPGDLKEHIKYPKDLFQIQLEKFSVFHMTDPRVFYNQEDVWERPKETYGGAQVEMKPYYLLGTLPGGSRLHYMLISPMTPKNRDNMISWMVVNSDIDHYGEIMDYELPKERLLLGPAQIEAKINQNTKISRQISLWDQRGSKVIRGNLMVIPIDNSFLYVEPVFLFSTSVNIPQLKRVIATTGSKVVMKPTLEEAIYALYGKENVAHPIQSIDSEDSTKQKVIQKIISSPQLNKIRNLWSQMQKSLKKGDWEAFGNKMDAIDRELDKKEVVKVEVDTISH